MSDVSNVTMADDGGLPAVPSRREWVHGDQSEHQYAQLLKVMPDTPRLAYWTIRVAEEVGRWSEVEYKEGLDGGYLVVGYVDPEFDDVAQRELGVIEYRFVDNPQPGKLIQFLPVDAIKVPIVRRMVRYEPQVNVRAPMKDGVATCWARGSHSDVDEGWVTARHVVQDDRGNVFYGDRIDFLSGNNVDSGSVMRVAPDDIDAALVHAHADIFSHWERMDLMPALLNLPVQFIQASGKLASGEVIEPPANPHLASSSKWPQRFTINRAGDPGDSGAMIVHRKSGEAVGIYLAQIVMRATSGVDHYAGVGLSVEQVRDIMELELYR
ncbi:hypothetical protein [Kitasatospora sp. NPDC005856]|uniref:hypothetical protein n=1 Tax=Kitasatospora sp. NPDC005856 TaxID=3154566 RepID=UPI0034053233